MPKYSVVGNPKKMKVPSHEELESKIKSIPNELDRTIAALLYGTGARVSEINDRRNPTSPFDLRLETINGIKLYSVNVRTLKNKNQFERKGLLSIGYDSWIILILKEWQENHFNEPYVKMARQNIRKHLIKQLGISPHCFRHYRVTNLIKDLHLTPYQLQKIMGWSSQSPLRHYMHLFLDDVVTPFKE